MCLASHSRDPVISQAGSFLNSSVHSLISSGTWCCSTISVRSHHTSSLLLTWLRDFVLTTVNLNNHDSILWNGVALFKVKT